MRGPKANANEPQVAEFNCDREQSFGRLVHYYSRNKIWSVILQRIFLLGI
ncbi:MAG: hypothetical protein ACI9CE_003470 [Flavobacterium sp.]|jgi:hypothetical protein